VRKKELQRSRKFDIEEFTEVCQRLHLLNDMKTLCQYYDMLDLYETLQVIEGITDVKIFVNRILTQSLGETTFSIEFTVDSFSNQNILIHTKLDGYKRKFIFYAGNLKELLGISEDSYLCIIVNDLETVIKHVHMLNENYISFLFQVIQFNLQQEKHISPMEAYQLMIEAKTKFINTRMTQSVFEVMEDWALQKYDLLLHTSNVTKAGYGKWKADIRKTIHTALFMYLSMSNHGYNTEKMKELLINFVYSKEHQQQLQENEKFEMNERTIATLSKKAEETFKLELQKMEPFYLNNHLDIDEKLLLHFDVLR